MARVLLVMPQLPQRLGAPYLGQLYLAASLNQAGHTTRAIDLGARFAPAGDEAVLDAVDAFSPDTVAMTLFTYNASAAYRLAGQLSGKVNLLVAGGPHVTVRPEEPLGHGFDLAIAGEGEISLPLALEALDAGGDFSKVPGAHGPHGAGPPTEPIARLEQLPAPHLGLSAFELAGYWPRGSEEPTVPGGMMTSRGCPARCTFCANYVTGRVFRWRAAEDVVAEMVALRRDHGVRTFPFWDDAFTAHRPRLDALCDAIAAEPALSGATWTCITPANMVQPRDLARMRAAGCVAINFGIESADASVLRTIEKGQRPDQVRAAVMAARAEGMSTVVNFMFGFPEEGVEALAASSSPFPVRPSTNAITKRTGSRTGGSMPRESPPSSTNPIRSALWPSSNTIPPWTWTTSAIPTPSGTPSPTACASRPATTRPPSRVWPGSMWTPGEPGWRRAWRPETC